MARNHPTKEQYREGARDQYAGMIKDGVFKVPEKAPVNRSEAEEGAWVLSLVWIRNEDVADWVPE
jgi:hypothetical protein